MITIKQKNGDIVPWSQISFSRARPARYTTKVFNGKITSFDDIKPLKVFKTQVDASCYIICIVIPIIKNICFIDIVCWQY